MTVESALEATRHPKVSTYQSKRSTGSREIPVAEYQETDEFEMLLKRNLSAGSCSVIY